VNWHKVGGLAAAAALLCLLLAARPAMAFAAEPNRAGLAVQFGDGHLEKYCIAFEGDEISGADLLARSDLSVIIDASRGMGITVCKIEQLGCDYPAQHCFCQCMGGGECAYWNYFYRDAGEAEWTYSPLGAVLRKVKPGAVEAWVWGDGHTPPPRDLTFEAVCTSPTPIPTATRTPEVPTPLPATATAAPTESQAVTQTPASSPAAPTATALPTSSPPASAAAGFELARYWPFGLMVLGLVLVGIWIGVRRR
jgi:hypothetical protein